MGDNAAAGVAESGEKKLSKNELKRQMKAEKKVAEKVEKVKAKAETTSEAETKKIIEEEISPNEYFKIRSAAVEALKADPARCVSSYFITCRQFS